MTRAIQNPRAGCLPRAGVRRDDLSRARCVGAWFVAGLAILQLAEGRLALLDTTLGRATSVALQLVFGYLLIGLTGAVATPYYLVLLFPIVSTASYLSFTGTLISTVAGIGALSFLSLLRRLEDTTTIDDEDVHVLVLRCLLPLIVAVLVNSLAGAIRTQSERYRATAEQLAKANSGSGGGGKRRCGARIVWRLWVSCRRVLAHELRNPLGSIQRFG